MPLLTVRDLSKSYGAQEIFQQLSFSIPHRARIGLVGANGVGKTTLLRILMDLEDATQGTVLRSRGLRVGYLPQEATLESNGTLWEECLTVFSDLIERQHELSQLEQRMSDPVQSEAVMELYGRRQHEFDLRGGYTYELRIHQTLAGLGFALEDEQRPVEQLSGGQKTRALLAKLLLSNPDLLLLDEPTNHLDISAVEWLEDYFKDWQGAALIVSHDRYFLDQVVSTIWEMTPTLEEYRGNYSQYLLQRGERYERQLAVYQAQQEFVEKEEEYIRRNIAGQNSRQAQGRRKRLEHLLEEARLIPPREPRRLHLHLSPVGRSGDLVLQTKALQIGYADEGRPLFQVPDLVLTRGECAAVIGPNGAGKTTLLKTLLAQIPPYAGQVCMGASLQIGYFAQAHEGLHPAWTLLQEIQAAAPHMRESEIRSYLAKFLFSGDDVFKTVEVLSGGERGRLALACLALTGANLLLLDEPTNHLDLPSQEVLQAVLADYAGTILLVSHDRYLIDALATQIWEVLPSEGALRVFEGTYSEYRTALLQSDERQVALTGPTRSQKPLSTAQPVNGEKLSKGEQKKRRQRLESLENEIAGLEEQLAQVSRQLEMPPADPAKVQRLGQEYLQLQQKLEQLMGEWEMLAAVD